MVQTQYRETSQRIPELTEVRIKDYDGSLVIHIGTTKIGTTSIQEALHRNYENLLARRVLYPRAGRFEGGSLTKQHHPLAKYLRLGSEAAYCEAVVQIKREILSTNPELVVISSEHLSLFSTSPAALSYLRNAFPEAKRTWVLYLRRQNEFAVSSYAERIKGGKISWPDSIHTRMEKNLDYKELIGRVQMGIGEDRLVVVSFDREKGKLVSSFFREINIDPSDMQIESVRNKQMPWGTLNLLRIANAIPCRMGKEARRVILFLDRFFRGTAAYKLIEWRPPLSLKQQEDLLKHYEIPNRWVEEKFWNGEHILTQRKSQD